MTMETITVYRTVSLGCGAEPNTTNDTRTWYGRTNVLFQEDLEPLLQAQQRQ